MANKQYGTSLEKERDKEAYISERMKEEGINPDNARVRKILAHQFEKFYETGGTKLGRVYSEGISQRNKRKSKKGGTVKTSKYSKGGGVRSSKYKL